MRYLDDMPRHSPSNKQMVAYICDTMGLIGCNLFYGVDCYCNEIQAGSQGDKDLWDILIIMRKFVIDGIQMELAKRNGEF